MQTRKIEKNTIIFAIGVIFITVFSVWKAQYGLGGKDVSFYLTIPYRMTQGDILFWNEWNLSQLSAFILYPLVKVYVIIVGGTEGIMINFRYIYIAVNLLITVYSYYKLKNNGVGAIVAMFVYYLFVPFNNMMLCYQSVGMMAGFLICIMVATNEKQSKCKDVIVGILYAIAVLCQPLLALGYIMMFIYSIKRGRNVLKRFVYITIGVIVIAIPVMLYIFIMCGVKNMFMVIPYMIKDLQIEHRSSAGIMETVKNTFWLMFPKKVYNIFGLKLSTTYCFFVVYLALVILTVILVVDKNRKDNYKKYICGVLVLNMILGLLCVLTWNTNPINILLLPSALGGVICCRYGNVQRKKLLKVAIIWGIIHTIGFMTSNCGVSAYGIAMFPISVCSVMAMLQELENKNYKKIKDVFICIILAVVIMIRACALFFDSSVFDLNTRLISGPAKNLKVNASDKKMYVDREKIMNKINNENGKVCIITSYPWMNLMAKNGVCEYSTYVPTDIKRVAEINAEYFAIHKEYPGVIYIDKKTVNEQFLTEIVKILVKQEYYQETDEKEGIVLKRIDQ